MRVRRTTIDAQLAEAKLIHELSGKKITCPVCGRSNCVSVLSRTGKVYDLRVRVFHDVNAHNLGFFDFRPFLTDKTTLYDLRRAFLSYLRGQPLSDKQQKIVDRILQPK